jgi:phage terminase small subunit
MSGNDAPALAVPDRGCAGCGEVPSRTKAPVRPNRPIVVSVAVTMPMLKNIKHERFANELAKGLSSPKAYVKVAFKENRHNAAALARTQHVKARVAEILAAAATRTEMSAADVLAGLTRIASCDIRKAVRWNSAEIHDEVDGEDGEGGTPRVLVRVENSVLLVNSDELDDDTAACISEVQQTKEGLRIKFHSKLDALGQLALFTDNLKVKHEFTLLDLVEASYKKVPHEERMAGRPTGERIAEAPTIEGTAIETAPQPVKVGQE